MLSSVLNSEQIAVNTPNGSWGMVQIRPTQKDADKKLRAGE